MSKVPSQPPIELQPLTEEEKRQIELAVDIQVRIIAGAYEKANAYTNLIIIAGYAGFFALWQMAKEQLGRKQTLLSALLMLLSLFAFVVFEIYKAHYSSRVLRRYQQVVANAGNKKSVTALVEAMNTFERNERNAALHFVTFWSMTFWITTITGVGAGIILGIAFVHRLIQ